MMLTHPARGLTLLCLLAVAVPARGDEPPKPTATASEANPSVPAAGHSIHGETFDAGPRQRAYLMPGQGKANFPITTGKPEAQAFMNQGVAQLHSFFYLEAERSFRQAALIDPASPMTYWGMAMANVNNVRRAKGFLKQAEAKAAKMASLSRRERLYLDALVALYKDGSDNRAQKTNHLQGLETIVQEFPTDLDARAWLAMVTWQNEGLTGIGSRQAVDTLIDSVIAGEVMHPGAYHYRIHLWDGSKFARAESAAGMYAKTAPGIAHAWHMPGHTYTNLKKYAEAAYQQEGSARVDHAYMFRDRVMPFEIHNYAHNNQWLSTSLSHIGRARDAIAVARNLVEQPRDPQANGPNDGGSPQRSGRQRWVEVLEKYELWDDLIAATTSGALDWTEIPAERVQRFHSLGLAYAAKGDDAKLAEQVAALKAIVDKDAKPAATPNAPTTGVVARAVNAVRGGGGGGGAASALAELEGYQLNKKGDYLGAMEKFKAAISMRPEALARAHLAAKNFGLAESAARKAVEAGPGQVLPLATLVEVLHAAGKEVEAKASYQKLTHLAVQADRDTPIFRRLNPYAFAWTVLTVPEDNTTTTDFNQVGPLVWTPYPAPTLSGTDSDGKPWSLDAHKGRNVVVLFYLGGKCAHCMSQLQDFGKEFAALKALGTDVVAVSTDGLEPTKALKANADGVKFPMPIIPDPTLALFKSYRSFDDFEAAPLHGTFLIDAKGNVRFQRIASDPFLDVDFLKKETVRVSKMVN